MNSQPYSLSLQLKFTFNTTGSNLSQTGAHNATGHSLEYKVRAGWLEYVHKVMLIIDDTYKLKLAITRTN